MSRLSRKNRTNSELGIKNKGAITDLIDNAIKSTWRINDKEYDFLLDRMTDDQMHHFIDIMQSKSPTFSEKRNLLIMVEYFLDKSEYRNEKIDKII
jgi:hypothetical protein